MFKNKHFIVALLVAPILSILAYVGTDLALSEKPHAAKKGEAYKLLSKSNCRYTSGLCDMENGEFKVQFRSEGLTDEQLVLSLKAKLPLQGIKVSLVDSLDAQSTPIDMQRTSDDDLNWTVTLPAPVSDESWLRVAIQADDTYYYGDTQTPFVVYETLLDQE
ncbi:hypothetical protein J4N42_13140 [Vibrio sp. SCSIO 43135]|uniref:hypothetical protein n=1 Tax=Vibrio sp. SCSIO 43135 TaxID=2819096 RepID=UPI002075F2EF|nr:hypothetical protein [Vibrio sp. SCSIO 43135]USD40947.1 hypothetical protein J4N42_13140 [Vibrio sp. SCSIO 43135]